MSDAPQREDYDSSLFSGQNRLFGEETLLGRIGDFYRGIGNNVQDFFTDYRSDDLAAYSTDFDTWNVQDVKTREDNAMQRKRDDLELAGYSGWFQGQGAATGGGQNLGQRDLSGGEAKRQSLGMMIQAATAAAQIGKTKAETDSIRARIPGETANSTYTVKTLQEKIDQYMAQGRIQTYEEMMANARVPAVGARAMREYYEDELTTAYMRQGHNNPSEITIEKYDSATKSAGDTAYGVFPGRFTLEVFQSHDLSNPAVRKALAEAISIAQARADYTVLTDAGVPSGAAGSANAPLWAGKGQIDNFKEGVSNLMRNWWDQIRGN